MENKEYTLQDAQSISKFLDHIVPADGVGTEREKLRMNLHREISKATEDLKETIKDLKIANLQRDSESSTTIFVLKKDNEKLTNIISEALSLSEKANKEIERLTQSNKELVEAFARIIDRIEEQDLQKNFPSAYKRAKAIIQKSEGNIKKDI